jgi:hypothetical protein
LEGVESAEKEYLPEEKNYNLEAQARFTGMKTTIVETNRKAGKL